MQKDTIIVTLWNYVQQQKPRDWSINIDLAEDLFQIQKPDGSTYSCGTVGAVLSYIKGYQDA